MTVSTQARQDYFVDVVLRRLEAAQDEILSQWGDPQGTNTRHFVVDNLLPDTDAEAIYAAFPRNGNGFFDRASFREKKRTSADLSDHDPVLADITYALQDARVVKRIGEMLNMDDLEPDPKLYAGGLSMMFPGDYLNPHIDNSHDSTRKRYRRLNLLYYVSPDWSLDKGGNFELWNDDKSNPRTIVSKQNRLVVMETNRESWHSVSPVTADRPRCCVSNYYFSKTSPDGSDYFHVTSFIGRPEQRVRSAMGRIDNALRNTVSKTLGIGRGKNRLNKDR